MSKPLSADRRNMILSGNLIQAILMLAIPVMINSFIQSMYNLTDTFWLGRIGTESQAAITLVSPIQNILINFGTGLTTAGAILISQYLGAKEDRQANSMANHVCLCSLLFSLVCAAVCWCITPGIVGWLGAEGNIFLYGISYLRIVVLDLPFLFMINIYTAVKQSTGCIRKFDTGSVISDEIRLGNQWCGTGYTACKDSECCSGTICINPQGTADSD